MKTNFKIRNIKCSKTLNSTNNIITTKTLRTGHKDSQHKRTYRHVRALKLAEGCAGIPRVLPAARLVGQIFESGRNLMRRLKIVACGLYCIINQSYKLQRILLTCDLIVCIIRM